MHAIYESSMYTSELCYVRLNQVKEMYTRRDVVAVHLNDHNNTMGGSGKLTCNDSTPQGVFYNGFKPVWLACVCVLA